MTIQTSSSSNSLPLEQTKDLQRIHPEKKLNAWMPLCTLENLKTWATESIEEKYWTASKSEQEQLISEKIQNVFNEQSAFRIKYHSQVDSCIKSVGYTMDAKQYLMYCVREVVKELSLNMDDDSDIQDKAEQFFKDFVQIRYNSGEHELNLKRCIEFINELLDSFHLMGQASYATHLKPYLELCSDLIQCDDLLEMSIPNLFSRTNISRSRLSVKMLTEGYYYSSQVLTRESDRILSLIQEEIKPFLDKQAHVLQFSQQVSAWLALKKATIMELCEFLCFRDPKTVALEGEKLLKLNYEAFSLTEAFDYSENKRTIANNLKQLNVLRAMLQIANAIVQNDKELVDWDRIVEKGLKRNFGVSLGTHSIEDFAMFIDFQEKLFEWHLLIDAFILPHVNTMARIHFGLNQWYTQNKRGIGRLLKIYHTPTVKRSQLQRSQLSVDELMAFINSSDSKTTSRSIRKKTQKKKTVDKQPLRTNNVNLKPQSSTNSSKKFVKRLPKPKIEQSLTPHQKIYEGLKKIICRSSTDPIERIAARQAVVSLQDIRAMQSRLKKNGIGSQGSVALNTLLTLQAAYYHMEQVLRLQNLKKRVDKLARLAFHNLQHQAKPLDKHQESIVYDLRMVNAWVPNTHRQMSQWESLRLFRGKEPPNALSQIHQTLDFPSQSGVTDHTLQSYLEKSLTFTGDFYSNESKTTVAEDAVLFDMKENVPIDTLKLKETADTIESNINSFPKDSTLQQTIKQVESNLITLQGVIAGLNEDQISSNEFSFLIRQAFYWQGQIMEKMMHAIVLKKTGEDLKKEHHLDRMYEQIFDESSDLLKDNWKQWHNITRYPYETNESQSFMHSLILAGEVLRDMPHLDEGYSFQDRATPFQDKQHFIPVPKELLSTKAIKKGLAEIYQSFLHIIENELLPELI